MPSYNTSVVHTKITDFYIELILFTSYGEHWEDSELSPVPFIISYIWQQPYRIVAYIRCLIVKFRMGLPKIVNMNILSDISSVYVCLGYLFWKNSVPTRLQNYDYLDKLYQYTLFYLYNINSISTKHHTIKSVINIE